MATYRVAPVNMGAANGQTWQDSMSLPTLMTTITFATNDEIWFLGENNVWGVGGRYQLNATFNIPVDELRLYGGFRGTETQLIQRNALISCNNPAFPDYFVFPTILVGGLSTANPFPIISCMHNKCVIDGFIIEQGLVPLTSVPGSGGLYVQNSYEFKMENVVFLRNEGNAGGGVHFDNVTDSVVKNCIIENNVGLVNLGGGVYLRHCKNVDFVNVLFFGNRVQLGTGVGSSAAAYIDFSQQIRFYNATVANNTVPNTAIPNQSIYCNNSDVEIYNSIFYPDTIAANPASTLIIDYCLLNQFIPGQNAGGLPFGTNPLFVNPTAAGRNYHLWTSPPFTAQSPCIDWGNNAFFPSPPPPPPNIATDLEGKPRFMGARIDMGVFEHNT